MQDVNGRDKCHDRAGEAGPGCPAETNFN